MREEKGSLFLVATPIGNLEDITLRAIRVLKEADLVAAEDTRHTLKLLNHLEIKKPLVSYHEHNKREREGFLLRQLMEGKKIAFVSDAGTPGISDPGEDLVRLAHENGIPLTIIPGPSAAIAGLVLSGLSTGRFVFEGFIPVNKRARRERLDSLKAETRTMVFYEAPHKLLSTLRDLYEVLGDRKIALVRELTKVYEEVVRCTLAQALEKYEKEAPRGEYVLVVEGLDKKALEEAARSAWDSMSLDEHVDMYLKMGLDRKEAIKKTAEDRGLSRREVYNSIIKKV